MTKYFLYQFWELFLLQGISLYDGYKNINPTTWYLSTLLISDLILFHCLNKWKDTFLNLLAPLIILVSFSMLSQNFGSTDAIYGNYALIRGLADMSLGILAGRFYEYLIATVSPKKYKKLHIIGILSMLFVILITSIYGRTTIDFLYTLILAFSVSIGFLPINSKLCNCKFIKKWSGITLNIYLVHGPIWWYIFLNSVSTDVSICVKIVYFLIYLIIITILAILLEFIVINCKKICSFIVSDE